MSDSPVVHDGDRRPPWLWIVAVAALAAAGVVFVAGRGGSGEDAATGGDATMTVSDARGDVVGPTVAQVGPQLDLRRVVLARAEGDLTLTFERWPGAAQGASDEPLTYAASLRATGIDYEVRASVSGSRAAATVTDSRELDRPYALAAPVVTGDRVRLRIPKAAVPRLPATFALGAAVRLAGSEDVAPADRSALFPPPASKESR